MLHEIIAIVAGYTAITILTVFYIESVMKSYIASDHPLLKKFGELYTSSPAKWPIWVIGFLWLPLLPIVIIFRTFLIIAIILKK